ncbi:hypothetical protein GGF50DRAFT_10422, partial [Schizophyllum commune]
MESAASTDSLVIEEEASASQRLPIELHHHILADADQSTLISYSLVCRAWTWPTRRYLFYSQAIDIDVIFFRGTKSSPPETMHSDDQRDFIIPESGHWATVQIERFTEVLRHNPALCLLYSRFNVGTRAWADQIYTLWGRETVIECAADDAIASCLDCLPNIVHLCTGESETPYSQTLQDAVAKTLRTSVERLSMAQDLAMMRPVREAIANSPRLRELSIASKEPHMPLG